jgi:hypothetical protein
MSQTDDLHTSDRQQGHGGLKDKEKKQKEKALLADLQNTADQSRPN